MNCQIGYRNSGGIWLMKVLQFVSCTFNGAASIRGTGSGKHSVLTHFPKDPNCETCLKTKITRASCRRRANAVMPRAEKFGDLITADHKVLSEESESRNNRHALVEQDLATQWLQSYPCKTKTSQETQKNLLKFLEPARKPKVIYTENSVECGKSCEELSWNLCTQIRNKWDC